MSSFSVDPQIQQLRAARAGDIAFASPSPAVHTIGKAHRVIANVPLSGTALLTAVLSDEPLSGMPSETAGPIVTAFVTQPSADTFETASLAATEALETLTGTLVESPVIGVGTGTSVS